MEYIYIIYKDNTCDIYIYHIFYHIHIIYHFYTKFNYIYTHYLYYLYMLNLFLYFILYNYDYIHIL